MTDLLQVTIDHVGAKGDGVALVDGAPLYVPLTVSGDVAEVRRDGVSARMVRLLTPGAERTEPPCPHFGQCGGCTLQHIGAASYAEWKRNLIIEGLGHRGFDGIDVAIPIISPPASRRRARLHALGRGAGAPMIGFHERASSRITDIAGCRVLVPEIMQMLPDLTRFMGVWLKRAEKAAIQITETETGLDVWFDTGRALDLDMRMDVAAFAEEALLARISWGADMELVSERRAPLVHFSGIPVAIPPGAFLQATKAGEEALTDLTLDALKGATRVIDLFAGCGTFTFPLAKKARVWAVEAEAVPVETIKRTAGQVPGLNEITAEKRDLFRRPLLAHELKGFDGLLFDPPRVGAKAQVEEIAKSDVPTVVAVSCNPATFARDARTLVDGGYRLGQVTPVDQFLWSAHVELVAVFQKG